MLKKVIKVMIVCVLCLSCVPTTLFANNRIEQLISEMSLREKIGQMMMPDFRQWNDGSGTIDVTEMNAEIAQIVADYKFGGIIFFANNLKTNEASTRLVHDFQQVAIDNSVLPLFTSVDQEGGKVTRLGQGTSLSGNMALGASGRLEDTFNTAKIIATEVDALGINVNFGPTLDVNNNPNNPVIGERSFSSDPERVAQLGVQYINGIEEHNVSASVKHFPGHGDTATDSHSGLPVVDKSYEELKQLELVPFQAAVNNGVDMIMTAHISYPQIETETFALQSGETATIPATLSKKFLTDILRNDMGYDGLVVTDALNMQAISSNFGEPEAAVRVIKAGGDIALMPVIMRTTADVYKIEEVYQAIEQAVATGEITEERIDESVRRILEVKEKRGILDYTNDTRTVEEKIAKAEAVVGSKEHHDIEREITQHGMTVGINENYTLPLHPQTDEKVVILTPYLNEVPALEYGINRLISEEVIATDANYEVVRFSSATTEEELDAMLTDATYVVAVSEISSPSLLPTSWLATQPEKILSIAKAKGAETVVISIGKPYDMVRYPEADAVVLAFGAKGMDPTEAGTDPVNTYGPNIPTSLDIVFGKVEPTATLPVEIPKLDETNAITSAIAFDVGYGLHNLQTTGTIKLESDKTVLDTNEEVTIVAQLEDYGILTEDAYHLDWSFDKETFEVVSEDKNELVLRALAPAETEITVESLIDAKNRSFTPQTNEPLIIRSLSFSDMKAKVDTLFNENGKVKDNVTRDEVETMLTEIQQLPEGELREELTKKLEAALKTITIRETPFEGLPEIITVGDTFTLYPVNDTEASKSGWSYDKAFFKATFNSPATFTAKKAGETTITYTDQDNDVQLVVLTIESASPVDNNNQGQGAGTLPTTGENIAGKVLLAGIMFTVSLLLVTGYNYRKARK